MSKRDDVVSLQTRAFVAQELVHEYDVLLHARRVRVQRRLHGPSRDPDESEDMIMDDDENGQPEEDVEGLGAQGEAEGLQSDWLAEGGVLCKCLSTSSAEKGSSTQESLHFFIFLQ